VQSWYIYDAQDLTTSSLSRRLAISDIIKSFQDQDQDLNFKTKIKLIVQYQ